MEITILQAIGYSILGFAIVFAALIILWGIIAITAKVLGAVTSKPAAAPAAPAEHQRPGRDKGQRPSPCPLHPHPSIVIHWHTLCGRDGFYAPDIQITRRMTGERSPRRMRAIFLPTEASPESIERLPAPAGMVRASS